jgi:tryptophanyl-tRNA synthetase
LLSGDLKDLAAAAVADFLEAHQQRRADLDSLEEELRPYRMSDDERERALDRVGFPGDGLALTARGAP